MPCKTHWNKIFEPLEGSNIFMTQGKRLRLERMGFKKDLAKKR